MAAQQQSEFDRLWSAIDSANAAIHSLEMRVAKRGTVPAPVQLAPSPDYRMAEPINVEFDEVTSLGVAPVEGPCGCEESVQLRQSLDSADAHVQQLLAESQRVRDAVGRERASRGIEQHEHRLALGNERRRLGAAKQLLERITPWLHNCSVPAALAVDVENFLATQPESRVVCPGAATCQRTGCQGCADGPAPEVEVGT